MAGGEFVGKEELQAIITLFERGGGNLYRYSPKGYAVAELEKKIAAFFGVRYAHAVASGTAAIKTALVAAGIRPGDEIISTCFTFVAPIEAMVELGAIPVLAEIDETLNVDPASVEAKITERTKAIVAVPMWAACDMDALQSVAEKHNLILLEDSAQCFGGTYKGKLTGTFGRVGSFSFDAGKTMTTGEGGIVITDDEELYRVAAEYSDHGHMHDPTVPRGQDPRRAPGFNFRMGELPGAVGCVQIDRVQDVLARQRRNYALVAQAIADLDQVKLRQFSDEEGQIASWLGFTLPDAVLTRKVVAGMLERKLPNSILPEAHEWHFAAYWPHVFSRVGGYDLDNLASYWPRSQDILSRSVGVFISAKMTEDEASQLGKSLREVITSA